MELRHQQVTNCAAPTRPFTLLFLHQSRCKVRNAEGNFWLRRGNDLRNGFVHSAISKAAFVRLLSVAMLIPETVRSVGLPSGKYGYHIVKTLRWIQGVCIYDRPPRGGCLSTLTIHWPDQKPCSYRTRLVDSPIVQNVKPRWVHTSFLSAYSDCCDMRTSSPWEAR